MPTAGPFSPSSVTDTQTDFSGFSFPVSWSDPGNATASDDSYATVTLGTSDVSNALRCTGFGITSADIPAGATIDGILIEVEASQDGGPQAKEAAHLVYSGTQDSGDFGFNSSNAGFVPDGTDTYWSLGGPTDTGNELLPTQAMVVDSSFGIDVYFSVPFSGSSSTVSVDHVRMTVYYTVAGAYILSADSGAISVFARGIFLRAGRRVSAATGAVSLGGVAAGLKSGRKIAAAARSYALGAQVSSLRAARRFGGVSGSYTLSASAAVLRRSWLPLSAASGSLSLTSPPASLTTVRRIPVTAAAVSIGATAGGLKAARSLPASATAFAVSASPPGLRKASRLSAALASYSVTATSAGLRRGYFVTPASASYVAAPQAGRLACSRRLAASAAAYSFSLASAGMIRGRYLFASVANLAVVPKSAASKIGRGFGAARAAWIIDVETVSLRKTSRSAPVGFDLSVDDDYGAEPADRSYNETGGRSYV